MTTNHPAHGPVSLDRLHQISEILSKASAQSDGGNLGYAMADAVKVINGAIAARNAEPVAWKAGNRAFVTRVVAEMYACEIMTEIQPLYTAPPAPVSKNEPVNMFGIGSVFKPQIVSEEDVDCDNCSHYEPSICHGEGCPAALLHATKTAPVVPPAIEPDYEVIKAILPTANPDEYACCIAADMWNACRASMLQAGNSPVTPDGWIPVSERTPEASGRYWCYVEEQNSLGKSHYQWNCSWNGEVWSDKALTGRVTHWMPLPSAPQQ